MSMQLYVLMFVDIAIANDIYPEINDIDCRGRNVMVKWTNHNQTVYNKIWDYCVFFNCSTPGGTVTDETVS